MIDEQLIKKLRDATKEDSKFLCDNGLMDYSLFLVKLTLTKEESIDIFGDHILERQEKESKILTDSVVYGKAKKNHKDSKKSINMFDNMRSNIVFGIGNIHDIKCYRHHLFPSLTQGQGYIIGIIDYLQFFNFSKQIESGFNTKFRKNGKKIISCINPIEYSDRFINYVEQLTDLHSLLSGTIKESEKETYKL